MPAFGPAGGTGSLFGKQRRKMLKRQYRGPLWVKVLKVLLVVLVVGDFANLFMAVESAMRSGYVVIAAVTVALTLLCVVVPFLNGKLWRQRAMGSRESNYPLVAALTLAWILLMVFITQLRLSTDGGPVLGIGGAASGGGSAIASLGSTSAALRPGSAHALTWLLTAMLFASGIVAFVSAWASADPVRVRTKQLELQRLDLLETHEELLALQEEYQNAEGYFDQVVNGDVERYEAMCAQTRHHAEYLKSLVRTHIAEQLSDPAATSALLETIERSTDEHEQSLAQLTSSASDRPSGQEAGADVLAEHRGAA
jgi:hypothetical protein